jgi:2-polyprenyl-6-methoxyphenol hydroxylase-like FAD-dependent oxidoreductase
MPPTEPGSADPTAPRPDHEVRDVCAVSCCIVGGGPAGVVLGYLLARQGIEVRVLEAHRDFDREFRGDTVHPSTLELLADLGLAEGLLERPHTKIRRATIRTPEAVYTLADFSRLQTRFPYIALIPQAQFLEFLAEAARPLPAFRLVMGANVKELVEGDGMVLGVRYQSHEGWHEVRADLTVACDGRFSKVRALAGLEPVRTAPPIDVLWFRLPRRPDDPEETEISFRVLPGRLVLRFDRRDYWQVGYVIPKGGYQALRAEGLDALRHTLTHLMPEFTDRVETLQSWTQIAPLSVESSRLRRWHRPGLLLIGDAAHVMSPVGGVGINYAIQDAVEASNRLGEPLRQGRLRAEDLAAVQRRRHGPTVIIQAVQRVIQDRFLRAALDTELPFRPPAFLRLPLVRRLIVRLIAFGPWPVHVRPVPVADRPGPGGSAAPVPPLAPAPHPRDPVERGSE